MVFAHAQFHINTVCDSPGILNRLGKFLEQVEHFILGLEIEFRCGIPQAIEVTSLLPCPETNMYVMSFPMRLFGIVGIIGANQRQIQVHRQFFHILYIGFFLRDAVILNFKIIPIGENLRKPESSLFCTFIIASEHFFRHFALQASGHANEPFAVLPKEINIDPWTVIKSFQISGGDKFHEIFITGIILGQQDKMVVSPTSFRSRFFLKTRSHCYIDLTPNNGLDSCFLRILIIGDHTEHISMFR